MCDCLYSSPRMQVQGVEQSHTFLHPADASHICLKPNITLFGSTVKEA
jgi:hypothetical protein